MCTSSRRGQTHQDGLPADVFGSFKLFLCVLILFRLALHDQDDMSDGGCTHRRNFVPVVSGDVCIERETDRVDDKMPRPDYVQRGVVEGICSKVTDGA